MMGGSWMRCVARGGELRLGLVGTLPGLARNLADMWRDSRVSLCCLVAGSLVSRPSGTVPRSRPPLSPTRELPTRVGIERYRMIQLRLRAVLFEHTTWYKPGAYRAIPNASVWCRARRCGRDEWNAREQCRTTKKRKKNAQNLDVAAAGQQVACSAWGFNTSRTAKRALTNY